MFFATLVSAIGSRTASTWAMLIAGFGFVGAARRRRRLAPVNR
jgi:MYXO-CTERM domain-containing protein